MISESLINQKKNLIHPYDQSTYMKSMMIFEKFKECIENSNKKDDAVAKLLAEKDKSDLNNPDKDLYAEYVLCHNLYAQGHELELESSVKGNNKDIDIYSRDMLETGCYFEVYNPKNNLPTGKASSYSNYSQILKAVNKSKGQKSKVPYFVAIYNPEPSLESDLHYLGNTSRSNDDLENIDGIILFNKCGIYNVLVQGDDLNSKLSKDISQIFGCKITGMHEQKTEKIRENLSISLNEFQKSAKVEDIDTGEKYEYEFVNIGERIQRQEDDE